MHSSKMSECFSLLSYVYIHWYFFLQSRSNFRLNRIPILSYIWSLQSSEAYELKPGHDPTPHEEQLYSLFSKAIEENLPLYYGPGVQNLIYECTSD
ncbi:hypothetical protein EGR_05536 [Echinococcus granulosus]|uniref:Uncharacterized protein n=1 Tax=Echinococcus granulosus TaxID=6210 RepID=W6UN72_ECHGR|nr:hypothetical protein EGR_05536 [Echinococcus granulosus]EUB59637.1 hypothetical protein EGR_05536 [Echinococcus granulosus]